MQIGFNVSLSRSQNAGMPFTISFVIRVSFDGSLKSLNPKVLDDSLAPDSNFAACAISVVDQVREREKDSMTLLATSKASQPWGVGSKSRLNSSASSVERILPSAEASLACSKIT